ncbi:glycoside hydrolase family 18 protein [Ephemerocybe angulata]|uniref:Glycoside hydrolase family 18 protein n=1 Tax=Ephemerocybe angulata TaxID=980116 RepID=A0A8H6M9V2_9AGAR|nr:glycoside hydrolase family 18 protein [Tulosesus angulatus]
MPFSASLGRNVLLVVMLMNAFMTATAQIMHRPAEYKNKEKVYPTASAFEVTTVGQPNANTTESVQAFAGTGKVSFAYFTNWGIYGANFQPTDIVPGPLTHILYSFADTNPSTGNIFLTDANSDEVKHYPGDSWDEAGTNLYGNLKQLYLLKLQKRNLKVLLSIGGWTYSQSGHFGFVTSSSARDTFVADAIKLVEDYGFDGIDIDFEYPSDSAQGQGLADLVTLLRAGLTKLSVLKKDATPYLITAAVGAGPSGYSNLNIPQLNRDLDYWNLMAYDYAGSWLTYVDNQANVYGGARTGFSTDVALTYYLNHGASANKINLGIPMYGRAYENTNGLGQSYSGIGPGTIEAGVYSYKALPIAGAQVVENNTDVTSYSYDSSKREFVSYDTPNIVRTKATYANNKGLAGTMFWELAQDKTGSLSLVQTSADTLGALDDTQNHINYPSSKFANLRNNFGKGGSTTPTDPPPTGGACSGVSAWSSSAVYVGGTKATYGGFLWTAKWWTQNEVPGGASGVWDKGAAC